MGDRQKFAILSAARRVWAVSSIHGEVAALNRLHRAMIPRLQPGDKLVYLGNLIGRSREASATLDSLLRFRSLFLARPDAFACDVVHLRGSQEEMWQKLLQLQFATDPRGVLQWMLDQGVAASLESYGFAPSDGLREAAAGPRQLTRWTGALRERIQGHAGHWQLLGSLRRAAYTARANGSAEATAGVESGAHGNQGWGLLFVNAGLEPERPLEAQKDSFWWGGGGFAAIDRPYGGYRRVVRGFCPQHPGLQLGDFSATLDAGCGFGGPLLAACFSVDGQIEDQVEAA
jgi:serine/threonine protein phosphatase 1